MPHRINAQPASIPQAARPYLTPILDSGETAEAGLYDFSPLANLPPFLYLEKEQAWLLTRYDDIKALLTDPRFESRSPVPLNRTPKKLGRILDKHPDHRAIKTMMDDAANQIAFLEKVKIASERATSQKLTNIATHKKLDSAFQYAYGVSNRTIAELFHIPEKHLAIFIRFSRAYIDLIGSDADMSTDELFHIHENLDIGMELIDTLDLGSYLGLGDTHAAGNQERGLDFLLSVLAGGLDLCIQLITGGIYLCARHENEKRKLNEESLWEKLPMEVYRYFSPISALAPKVAAGNFSLNAHSFKKGDRLLPLVAAANRDKDKFLNPAKFDVGRDNSPVIFYDANDNPIGRHFALTTAATALEHYFNDAPHASEKPSITL